MFFKALHLTASTYYLKLFISKLNFIFYEKKNLIKKINFLNKYIH
jgi:hypothetical protein